MEDAYFAYLDRLNALNACDMTTAGIYLECRFMIGPKEAARVLKTWFAELAEAAYAG